MLREWNLFLQDYPLVLTPSSLQPPFLANEDLQGDEAVRRIFNALLYTSAMNLLGLPAAVTPVLLDHSKDHGETSQC